MRNVYDVCHVENLSDVIIYPVLVVARTDDVLLHQLMRNLIHLPIFNIQSGNFQKWRLHIKDLSCNLYMCLGKTRSPRYRVTFN